METTDNNLVITVNGGGIYINTLKNARNRTAWEIVDCERRRQQIAHRPLEVHGKREMLKGNIFEFDPM